MLKNLSEYEERKNAFKAQQDIVFIIFALPILSYLYGKQGERERGRRILLREKCGEGTWLRAADKKKILFAKDNFYE